MKQGLDLIPTVHEGPQIRKKKNGFQKACLALSVCSLKNHGIRMKRKTGSGKIPEIYLSGN